ncbi:uncharacterized protein LOC136767699 [Amia ocellicauda]|uniref:uncharacterized protein LOC136767699 n=1 Tax=Amia ocellicauda TaxID=2972642 RepID=UPI003463B3F5
MLGELCQCQAVTAHIREELQEALVRLVLHLPDSSPKVFKTCYRTLNNTGSVPELSTIRRLIFKNKQERALDFRTFLDDLAFWASDFPEALGWSFSCALDCLSSRFPGVKACAAIFTESLIKNTPQSLLSRRWMDQSIAALTRALQEESDSLTRLSGPGVLHCLPATEASEGARVEEALLLPPMRRGKEMRCPPQELRRRMPSLLARRDSMDRGDTGFHHDSFSHTMLKALSGIEATIKEELN